MSSRLDTIARIGSGAVSVARAAARGVAATDVAAALHEAIEAGIELVEIAAEEDAEHLAGAAIRSLRARDRVIAACRVPVVATLPSTASAARSGDTTLANRLPARYVQERIESSLRATRLDALSLAQLPVRAAWRSQSAWPELAGTCARLVREGKVVEWGAFVDSIEDDAGEADDGIERLRALADEPWLVSINVPLNLCERAALPLIGSRLAVLARRPLAGAALAGTIGPGVQWKPTDDRRVLAPEQLERITVGVAKLAAYVKQTPPAARSCDAAKHQLERNPRPAELHCQTVAELALRYVITAGAIALPRLHRREHVRDALATASAPPLPPELVDLLDI